MRRWGALTVVAAAMWAGCILHAQDGYKIIVNPANPVLSVSRAQITAFFLENATWDDGQRVSAVDLPPTSPVREAFSRDVLNMPVSAVIARWRNASGLGRGEPPPSMASDREVLAYVRLKPGAIGYLSPGTDAPGVKVIVIGKAASTAASQEVLEVGGVIPMPERIVSVTPVYPLPAKAAKVQGDVDVEVVIGAAGNVESAKVVRSIPMLDPSALAAVKQWKYKPTMVNGVPVAVKTRVRVSFTL